MPTWIERIVDRIERAEQLDRPADAWAAVVEKPLQKSARLRSLLSGTAFGHPVHPLLVSLPIGSFVAASALDLAGEHAAAHRLIVIGLVTAVPTAATGGSDWVYTTGAERRVGFVHAASNWIALAGYGASLQARRRGHHGTGTGLALTGAAVLSVAGWLGGHLVYARGVGIDTTAFLVAPEDWQDTVAETELVDGAPIAAEVNGVAVVLIKQGDEIYALDDRCTHRGGPLHEGSFVDGCLRCPWHDSSFRIEDGAVVDGPATRPQRRWQVRRRYGRIEVQVPAEAGSLRTNVV